jgi:molybdopterin converting factor subunit 1
MARVHLRYYALLREQAGRQSETVETAASTPAALYAELSARHRFRLPQAQLRVAVNAAFTEWSSPLADGDEVVFIPPVAGG